MSNEQFLERWEEEKRRLAALGHEWSFEDAYRFSLQLAAGAGHERLRPVRRPAEAA